MMRTLLARIPGFVLALAFGMAPVCAQPVDEAEKFSDLIHADLPLFGDETSDKWPQSFADDESFGCISRVEFGVWALTEGEEAQVERWYNIQNYGAFHCFAIVSSAYERDNLEDAEGKHSFFVYLGKSDDVEFWALQIGGRPGSEYLLLSREPAEGAISKFAALQTKCPKQFVRDAGPIDILRTRYCAINSKSDLRNFARQMSKLEPLGELMHMDESEGLEGRDQPN